MALVPNRPFFPPEDRSEIAAKVEEILESGILTQGPYTKQFEDKFAARIGVRHAVAVSSGTAALELIYRYLLIYGSNPEPDLIVPTNTFIATPNAVYYAGGNPVFADISKATLCLDLDSLKVAVERYSPWGGIATIVHIGGLVTPQIGAVKDYCEMNGLLLVEDAAHAHGSSFKGRAAGRFGIAAAFSFYPTKTMTSAEGGMIVTDEDELDRYARCVRDQGKSRVDPDVVSHWGYNWRMSELHALLGLYQLKRLDEFLEKRRRIARAYNEELESLAPTLIPQEIRLGEHSLYKYVVFLHEVERSSLKQRLLAKSGLRLPGEVYAVPCHQQPVYQRGHLHRPYYLPWAEEACRTHICLPIHAAMTEEQAVYVVNALKEAVR